ncbi:MAG: leucine-rich repeat protein [Treponema sp.]|uniref:leucine-rich repeat protein n=1 Tax=Treponema sp. TaxID=166 RepID=UPI00298E4493|nr:leucine-rich repeat protein [Treponema sp.]MBR5933354.1 leucine-rich repeat protein [Treponema sp.]
MKKVFCKMALAAVLALTTLFTGCKAPSSGGGSAYNPPEKNIPLTLEAIADGQITFNRFDKISNLKYRINDGEVTAATDTGISLPAGDKISLFAEGTLNGDSLDQAFRIICSSDCYVYGNVMSLLTADYQTATEITQNYAFAGLFFNNSHIKNHPSKNIVLPATTLADNCYMGMFYNCSSLTQAPVLPATTLADYCYYGMFEDCTSLTQAPVLPATTLATICYGYMFSGCTSLTQAPALPATTLAKNCYYCMFYGCTSLNKVTCLATDLSAIGCTDYWLTGVASSGTFTKASGADWSVKTGYNGIPDGWTTQNK